MKVSLVWGSDVYYYIIIVMLLFKYGIKDQGVDLSSGAVLCPTLSIAGTIHAVSTSKVSLQRGSTVTVLLLAVQFT